VLSGCSAVLSRFVVLSGFAVAGRGPGGPAGDATA
jgi:hypothetical protein